MSSSKIDRARYGPGWGEVVFGALLSVVLGVVLCAVWLVLKPVPTVTEAPRKPEPGTVYYIRGSADSDLGKAWLRKRHAFLDGQSIGLTEDELNMAVATPMERPKTEPGREDEVGLTPGVINFHVARGKLQVALPVKVAFFGRTVIVQASGDFERRGGFFQFVPTELYVGSCPVERLPVIRSLVLKRIYAAQDIPDELVAAWDKLSEVRIEGRVLKLEAAP